LVTEYEQLLQQMLEEGRTKLEALKAKRSPEKALREQESNISFMEVELQRYQQGMALFRTKKLPRVGRWGKPEADPRAATTP
jgi:hypothetical protein